MEINLDKIVSILDGHKLSRYPNKHSIFRYYFYEYDFSNIKLKQLKHKLKSILYKIMNREFTEVICPDLKVKKSIYGNRFISRVCFGEFLRALTKYDRAVIEVFLNTEISKDRSYFNNFIWMTKEQVKEHLDYLKDIIGLDFDFSIWKEKVYIYEEMGELSGLTVQIDFKKLRFIEIKYVLFWLRFTYEYPLNIIFIDALLLKEKYPEEELYNLFLVPTWLIKEIANVEHDQVLSKFGTFVNEKRLKKFLANYQNVIEIYDNLREYSELNSVIQEFKQECLHKIHRGSTINYSAWFNCKERLVVYDKIYKTLDQKRLCF